MAPPNLLFIDTNILLDFYRAGNEIGLQLLKRIEKVSDRLIVTYQLESEFKKNRQVVMWEGMKELKEPSRVPRLGIFSDAAATKGITKNLREAGKRARRLHSRLVKALADPAKHDPVYKICQRLFQKNDALTLTREDPVRRLIRRSAHRRLLHGCPPGKRGDTSYGDAFNWEWMVRCAINQTAGLVIVSRDQDYGITIDGRAYVNDHLRHEFSDRVSRKRKLVLHTSLSEALKSFDVSVPKEEEQAENEIATMPMYGEVPALNRGELASAWAALRSNPAFIQTNTGLAEGLAAINSSEHVRGFREAQRAVAQFAAALGVDKGWMQARESLESLYAAAIRDTSSKTRTTADEQPKRRKIVEANDKGATD